MSEKIPYILKPLLYEYESNLKKYFGNKIFGVYLYNSVTWWTLKYNGIPINSPNVKWDNIVETMNYNLNSYWKKKLYEKDIFLSDEWIEFAVLTLCRILYTLDNKSITTKIQSA
ncbi:hypothetical protein JYG23_13305 [Sedimentibacter sp. zth1]|uniref:hypothetical protein n=1 Tax=Sedimentibacter sp. zth1 TaxID=2816908 RepID=UPI001A9348AC|nr:hypothetical protein [Sedimentibacter sp. zth1]QSX05631.1 hypothetical protein JYG23_13305 [Sedimentibacter sp. zth1]